MTILHEINQHKHVVVAESKKGMSQDDLCKSPFFNRTCNSLKAALLAQGASGIIAEFKTCSPSKGTINDSAEVSSVTKGYIEAGASALSVLTEERFFGGTLEDLAKARFANPNSAILRKDFIVDSYQIYEAKAHGADAILLIAESLSKDEIASFTQLAHKLGLEVLLELHKESELNKICLEVDVLGINNRDLETFEVDIQNSINLATRLPKGIVKISESGISSPDSIKQLRNKGFNGFLIGESFMKEAEPAKACNNFIKQL